MKWLIPAKTFLLGEYAALAGGPAIILTTLPCFEFTLTKHLGLEGIHPLSPAGKYWTDLQIKAWGLQGNNPYKKEGIGSSSAQFLAVYLSDCFLKNKRPRQEELLEYYFNYAWQGEGLRPSGYDLLAQTQQGCVYLNRKQGLNRYYQWPFEDIVFILIHSGNKLPTHTHLQALCFSDQVEDLTKLVEDGRQAFERVDSGQLITAINDYYQALCALNLVAEQTQQHIATFQQQPGILAAKGCGAMGADVFLLLVKTAELVTFQYDLTVAGWSILATSRQLYNGNNLI